MEYISAQNEHSILIKLRLLSYFRGAAVPTAFALRRITYRTQVPYPINLGLAKSNEGAQE